MADFTQLLEACSRADKDAERTVKEYEQRDFPGYMAALAQEIATEGKNVVVRRLAGLLIKNALFVKDEAVRKELQQRWTLLDGSVREAVKQPLLAAIRSPEADVTRQAAQAASEIAAVEIPYNQWPAFVPSLLENIQSAQSTDIIRVASLECLGFTCERVSMLDGPEIDEQTTDSMLNAIVDGIQQSRPDSVRFAATKAFKNSLIFAHKNMEKKAERDAIMTNICEATRCQDYRVREAAYECIVQIAVSYYDKLQDYMTTLYELTTDSIRKDQEEVAKAALEFWSSLGEVEQELIDEAEDLNHQGLPVERQCMRYVAAALTHLVPILLETLTKQDEEADEDTYNLHMAGNVCLSIVSQTVEDAVVGVVMPFVQQNIASEDWRLREAAMMAFTGILDGPKDETIGPAVSQSVSVLLKLLNDPHVMVRDTAAHCISKICELHVRFLPTETFPVLLKALTDKCGEGSPKVASQACSALYNLANAFSEEASHQQQSNALSPYMQHLLETLLKVCDRPDSDESFLLVAAMEAISVLISNSADDVIHLLVQLLPAFVQRFENSTQMQDFDAADQLKKEQTQQLLCAVFQALYRKLDKPTLAPYTDKVMSLLLGLLHAKNAFCQEECFSCISAISDALEADFEKYMPQLQPFLVQGLRNFQAYQVCKVAVGTVGDISRNIEGRIQPYCDEIMHALVESLKDSTIHRSVKPPVLSCFGEIAMAIGAAYQPYLQFSIMLLMQASSTQVPPDDEDLVDYFNILRESILEAYIGIVQGLKDGNLLSQFMQYVPSVMQFLESIANDPKRDEFVLNKAVGLIGDLAQSMPREISPHINKEFVARLLNDAMNSGDQDMAQWANTVVTQAVQGIP